MVTSTPPPEPPASSPEYRISLPGYDHLVFGASSKDWLSLPDAVRFQETFGGVLQSAPEAVAFRLAANGVDHANDYQLTRTAAIYYQQDGKTFIAFDDDPSQNILLTRTDDGYESHRKNRHWNVPLTDPLLSAAINRAVKHHRVVRAMSASVQPRLDDGSYERHPVVNAILGSLANAYGTFLREQGYENGHVWTLTPADCEQLGVNDHTAEVRWVGVGRNDIGGLDAINQVIVGRARRVRDTRQNNGDNVHTPR